MHHSYHQSSIQRKVKIYEETDNRQINQFSLKRKFSILQNSVLSHLKLSRTRYLPILGHQTDHSWFSSVLKPACTGLQEPIVYIFSLLCLQWHQVGSLKLSMGGEGIYTIKTGKHDRSGLFFLVSQQLNMYQHTTISHSRGHIPISTPVDIKIPIDPSKTVFGYFPMWELWTMVVF